MLINLVSSSNLDQLSRAEQRIEAADHHVRMSDSKTKEIKVQKRFFMMPTFGAQKKAEKEQKRLELEFQESKKIADDRHQMNIERSNNLRNVGYNNQQRQQFYTTPDGLDRDEFEEEIDGNLNEISSGLDRIRLMGQAMNSELNVQNEQIGRIGDKSSRTHERVNAATGRVNQLLDKKRRN